MEKLTLLLVDDDPIMAKVVEKALLKYDLFIEYEADPIIALEKIITTRPRIVIIDMHMPVWSGRDLIVKISENKLFKDSSFFMITGSEMDQLENMKMMTLGFEGIFTKPFSNDEFIKTIERSVGPLKLKAA